MKVPREKIKSTGLSVVYEPDNRTDVNLDIILVHGLGGHPVKTWLHTPANEAPAKKPSSTNLASSSETEPARALSLKYLASPNLKKGNTLKKPRNGEAPPRLRVFGSPLRPRSVDFSDGAGGSGDNIAVASPSRVPRRGSRRNRRAAAPAPLQSPPGRPKPAFERWAGDDEEADEACDLATFWPTDLLPDLCCDTRILTWGFRTRTADGMLVPGQFDIFSRGRELLNDVNDLLASYGEHGQSREVVFVAHSTGGIVIKEMLRLAHSYEDTQNRPLLASIAGIVFIGCPLRNSASGTMVEAMRSMAAAAIGVDMHDHVLQDLLGGDTPLAYEGRDALEEIRHEYGFPVKTYRETIIIPPADDTLWPWVALALRRDSGSLEGGKEHSEYIEADHLNMCRFASAGNDGYRSIASFILRLAHHQLLRKHRLTPEEEASLHFLAAPGNTTTQPPQSSTPTIVFPGMPTRKAPPWLLKRPAFRSWYHRKNSQDRQKVLWLRGPAACGKSELLSSLISHISTEWSPATHSSAIMTVIVEGESLLESIVQKSDGAQNHNSDHKKTNQDKQSTTITTAPPDQTGKSSISNSSTTPAGGPTHETASPLRTILQHLWAHDPRLRNLVGGLAKASSLQAREADSCDGPDRTQSDAGAREPQPQHPKVYSRRPSSGVPGGGGAAAATNRGAAQGPRLKGQVAADVGSNKEVLRRTVRERYGDEEDDAIADDERLRSGQSSHQYLDDARLVSFFLEDYLRLQLPQTQAQASEEGSRAAEVKVKPEEGDKGKNRTGPDNPEPAVVVETPGTRRIFVLVDIAPTTAPATARDLLWCLAQLARRSTLSICVASRELDGPGMAIKHGDSYAEWLRGPRGAAAAVAAEDVGQQEEEADEEQSTMLTVDVATFNAEDVASYIESALLPDIEDRDVLAAKLAERSRGVMFWLEHAVAIVNDASEDGVSGEIVCSMLDDIAPAVSPQPAATGTGTGSMLQAASRSRSGSSSSVMAARAQDPGQARLDDLYAWKLRRLSVGEARAALVLMQWVMLAPEALRLNELLVAIRLTMLVWPQNGGNAEEQGGDLGARALDIEPPMSLKDLRRRPAGGAEYVPADNPSQFWRWTRRISQGLVKLDGESRTTTNSSNSKVSSEPLGLQRVVPAHESVRHFFLEGRGFQILTPLPLPSQSPSSKTKPPPPTTEQLIDTSYYALLHTCLVYLNMTDFDSLSRGSSANSNTTSAHIRTPSEPPSEAEEESTRLHRSNAEAQRALVTSSYPLLRYTVDNLLFHLLRPRALRYFPPQARLLRLLTADGCRIWRRWTRLLGIPDTTAADVPAAVLEKARRRPSAAVLLRPVYGASFRLERVLRRACKTAREQAVLAARARAKSRLRSQRSARSVKSAGDKAPPTPRTPTRPPRVRSASESSVVFALVGGGDDMPKAQWLVPRSPRSPRLRSDSLGSIGSSSMSNPASPGVLLGIQEV